METPRLGKVCLTIADRVFVSSNVSKDDTRLLHLEEFISLLQDPHVYETLHIFLITGPSGVGKSWLFSRLYAKLPKAKFLNLDKFGSSKTDKWLIDVDKVSSTIAGAHGLWILEGQSDNMMELTSNVPISRVVALVPEFETFISIQRAKAKDGALMSSHPEWVKGWEEKSRMSEVEFLKYMVAKLKVYAKFTAAAPMSILCLPKALNPIKGGWHGK